MSGVKMKNKLLTVNDFRIINPNENGIIKKLIVYPMKIGKNEKNKFKIVIDPIKIPARETSLITSWFFTFLNYNLFILLCIIFLNEYK
ncbi:MAG: hypothetical protein ACRCWU_00350 [Metamycoplasmataceae bacterium]